MSGTRLCRCVSETRVVPPLVSSIACYCVVTVSVYVHHERLLPLSAGGFVRSSPLFVLVLLVDRFVRLRDRVLYSLFTL